jgi:hypothetical protein
MKYEPNLVKVTLLEPVNASKGEYKTKSAKVLPIVAFDENGKPIGESAEVLVAADNTSKELGKKVVFTDMPQEREDLIQIIKFKDKNMYDELIKNGVVYSTHCIIERIPEQANYAEARNNHLYEELLGSFGIGIRINPNDSKN